MKPLTTRSPTPPTVMILYLLEHPQPPSKTEHGGEVRGCRDLYSDALEREIEKKLCSHVTRKVVREKSPSASFTPAWSCDQTPLVPVFQMREDVFPDTPSCFPAASGFAGAKRQFHSRHALNTPRPGSNFTGDTNKHRLLFRLGRSGCVHRGSLACSDSARYQSSGALGEEKHVTALFFLSSRSSLRLD